MGCSVSGDLVAPGMSNNLAKKGRGKGGLRKLLGDWGRTKLDISIILALGGLFPGREGKEGPPHVQSGVQPPVEEISP